jgi:hypothetical protein
MLNKKLTREELFALTEEQAKRSFLEDSFHENGQYECICTTCNKTFTGHKRRITCKVCMERRERMKTIKEEIISNITQYLNKVDTDVYKYVAVDKDGSVQVYKNKPQIHSTDVDVTYWGGDLYIPDYDYLNVPHWNSPIAGYITKHWKHLNFTIQTNIKLKEVVN